MAYSKTFIDNLIANYDPSETTIMKYAMDNGVAESQMRKWLKNGSNRKRDAQVLESHPHPDFLKKLDKDVNPIDILTKLAGRVWTRRYEHLCIERRKLRTLDSRL